MQLGVYGTFSLLAGHGEPDSPPRRRTGSVGAVDILFAGIASQRMSDLNAPAISSKHSGLYGVLSFSGHAAAARCSDITSIVS